MPAPPAALWLLGSLALAGPRGGAWYDNTVLELPTHGEEDRALLTQRVEDQVDHLELVDAQGAHPVGEEELATLPLAALVLLQYTGNKRHAGGELDVLVPLEGGHQAITVWWEGSTRARWSPRELKVVAAALARVETRARPALQGQPMVRRPGRVGRGGAASHVIEDGKAQFEFHDDPFLADCCAFVGAATDPVPTSVFVVLHEVGHALVSWPALSLVTRSDALAAEYTTAYARYEADFDRFNRAVEAYNAAPSEANLAAIEAVQAQVEASGARGQELASEVDSLDEQVRRTLRRSPVLDAWERVPGHSPGPTPYSRESAEESFAECYALFHTDPEALRRARPAVYAWLAAGSHLVAAGL